MTRMARHRRFLLALALCGCLIAAGAFAQFRGGGGRRRGAPSTDPDQVDRGNVPKWDLDPQFKHDCFTFVRIKYRSTMDRTSYAWWTDYPDADLNFSWRLSQLTSLKVDPYGKVIDITDEALFDYPFAIMSGVPAIQINDEEAAILRRYMLNGGFILVDDFWGDDNYEHFYREVVKQVFPKREPQELALDHPIFHCVYDLKEKPQIPNVGFATGNRNTGITSEDPEGKGAHYRALFDDKGRMMMLICHNTDLGDGWEEEATDPWYFKEFSEKKAYPMGINIIYYVMTH
jgi:Domain of unknown function (DUF4159)